MPHPIVQKFHQGCPDLSRHACASPCDTDSMQSPLQAATAATDPKSVKVNLSTGTGVDIEWNDGHVSHYNFVYLRDACPCAMCEDERGKAGRRPAIPSPPLPARC